MATITEMVPWHITNDPHPSALNNLRILSNYMMTKGYTNETATVSAYTLSDETGIAYKQVRNLIVGRPGFVRVTSGPTSRYFYIPQFGANYPASLDSFRSRDVPLVVEHTNIARNLDPSMVGLKKVAEQSGGVFLRPGQVVISPEKLLDPVTTTAKDFEAIFLQLMAAVANHERTPTQAAEWMYRNAEGIQSGTITLTFDSPTGE